MSAEIGSGRILQSRLNGVVGLDICWPERRNALSPDMLRELAEALAAVDCDETVRMVVIQGADQGPFSSGYDIGSLRQHGEELPSVAAKAIAEQAIAEVVEAIRRVSVPVAALVRRYSIGASLEVLAACDMRFCEPNAVFALPAVRVGVAYSDTGIRRLSRGFSSTATSALMWSPSAIEADRARELGIIHASIEGNAEDFLRERAEYLSLSSRNVVAQLKRNMAAGLDKEWSEKGETDGT